MMTASTRLRVYVRVSDVIANGKSIQPLSHRLDRIHRIYSGYLIGLLTCNLEPLLKNLFAPVQGFND